MPSTNAAIIAAVRELSFDRFVTPSFFIAQTGNLPWTWTVAVDDKGTPITVTIKDNATPTPNTQLTINLSPEVIDMFPLPAYIRIPDVYYNSVKVKFGMPVGYGISRPWPVSYTLQLMDNLGNVLQTASIPQPPWQEAYAEDSQWEADPFEYIFPGLTASIVYQVNIQAVYKKGLSGFCVPFAFTTTADANTIVDGGGGETVVMDPPTTVSTMDELIQAIMLADLPLEVVYSGSFVGGDPANALFPKSFTMQAYMPVFRSYYFSNLYIQRYFKKYAQEIMNSHDRYVNNIVTDVDWDEQFNNLAFDNYRQTHFVLWVAFQLVGDRRLYEVAAQSVLTSSAGGNPQQVKNTAFVSNNSFSLTSPGDDTTIQVADVFTLRESPNTYMGVDNDGEVPANTIAPWNVGADNTLMDYFSFWYRLQCWIRDRLEQETGDYSLRKNNIMTGQLSIDPRDSNKFFSYFDSYPWVFSPYLRGVPYGSLQNLRT